MAITREANPLRILSGLVKLLVQVMAQHTAANASLLGEIKKSSRPHFVILSPILYKHLSNRPHVHRK